MALDNNMCNTGLVLGLSIQSNTFFDTPSSPRTPPPPASALKSNTSFEPSLTLGLSAAGGAAGGAAGSDLYHQASPNSALSSFSNVSVKRERDLGSEERVSPRINDEDEDSFNTRKKLRLTKQQSALLEDSFKEHSTLNPKQKQALARQLNLRPRQVEVWFQNRRARTKLKQTEVDCEFLKKCRQTLTDENKKLQKELQELRALKLAQPFYMQIPAATLSMCPSCERISGTGDDTVASKTPLTPFAMASAKNHHHLYNPFTNPSAAC